MFRVLPNLWNMTLLAIHIIILGMRDAAPPEKSLSLTPGAMLAPYILVPLGFHI